MTPGEETGHLKAMEAYSIGPVGEIEYEDMDFYYGDNYKIINDEIILKTNDAHAKLAISFALASSCKLDVYENRVAGTITETKHIPEDLAKTGSIKYSKTEISQLIGRLFIVVRLIYSLLISLYFFIHNFFCYLAK